MKLINIKSILLTSLIGTTSFSQIIYQDSSISKMESFKKASDTVNTNEEVEPTPISSDTPEYKGGTKFFNKDIVNSESGVVEQTTLNKNNNVIGEDTLPKENIEKGTISNFNMGEESSVTGKNIIDTTGNAMYLKKIVNTPTNNKHLDFGTDYDKTDLEGITFEHISFNEWIVSQHFVDFFEKFYPNENADTYTETQKKEMYNVWLSNKGKLPIYGLAENKANNDKEYKEYKDGFETYFKIQDLETKRSEYVTYRDKAKAENLRRKNTVNAMREKAFAKKNMTTEAQSTTRSFRGVDRESNFASKEDKENDANATFIYNKLYSINPIDSGQKTLQSLNMGALSNAMQGVSSVIADWKSKINNSRIECEISRELIPSYICPMNGKSALRFPSSPDLSSLKDIDLEKAKEQCNEYCISDIGTMGCTKQQVMSSTNTGISIQNPIEVFPNWNEGDSTLIFNVDNTVPIKNIDLSIKITQPSSYTAEEWKDYVDKAHLKMKYSILSDSGAIDPTKMAVPSTNPNNSASTTVTDRETIKLISPEIHLSIPVNVNTTKIKIKFWKPFIESNALYRYKFKHIFDEMKAAGSSIKIDSISGEYSSDSFHFCRAKQMVLDPNDCIGGDIYLFESVENQLYYFCSAKDRKIGPEPIWGAFYSEDSCLENCRIQMPCETTYSHYNGSYGTEEELFKADIGCVKREGGNTNCTKALCEDAFKDEETRPINEYYVKNDDELVYTVKHGALTDNPRPKIDISNELSINHDWDETFENEQKDQAYLSMLDNISYNKLKYKVGEVSPMSLAYHKTGAKVAMSPMSIDLKPKSTDYDSSEFYIYSVIRVEHSYTPMTGSWYLNGKTPIKATQTNIQWKDLSYMIKTEQGDFKVFRVEEYYKYLVDKIDTTIDSSTGEVSSKRVVDWVKTNQHLKQNFVRYNKASDRLDNISGEDKATYFTKQRFLSSQDIFTFHITSNIQLDIKNTLGVLIAGQKPKDHATKIEKLYDSTIMTPDSSFRSVPKDYTLYLVYSATELTNDELMKKIEGDNYSTEKLEPTNSKYAAYQLINERLFNNAKVQYDGLLSNNIDPLLKGNVHNTTISVDIDPALSEKGKKVFKFLFLYDEQESDTFDMSNDI